MKQASNIGVLSSEEQKKIRKINVAVIGCGGMGGVTAQILARTGIEHFIIADPDKYETVNINNQFNAFESTRGKNKAEVVAMCLKDINPNTKINVYEEGLTNINVTEIVRKADIIFDCIDYNELYYSYILTTEARKKGKFVLAPQAIGYGASVVVYDPNGVSFNEYHGINACASKKEINEMKISPKKFAPIIPKYIDESIINSVVNREIPIPNIALAQTLAASIMVAEGMFILLNKRQATTVPRIIAIDLLQNKFTI